MRFKSRLTFSRFITFSVILLIGLSLIASGTLVGGLEFYEKFGGIGIGLIMCFFAAIYLKLNTKIKFVSIGEGFLNLEYRNGEKYSFALNRIELVENYDGSRYFAAQVPNLKRKVIIDPKNFNKPDEMQNMILRLIKKDA